MGDDSARVVRCPGAGAVAPLGAFSQATSRPRRRLVPETLQHDADLLCWGELAAGSAFDLAHQSDRLLAPRVSLPGFIRHLLGDCLLLS